MFTVRKENLVDLKYKIEIAGVHGVSENKSIIMVSNTTEPTTFEVTDGIRLIGVYEELEKAVDVFNVV